MGDAGGEFSRVQSLFEGAVQPAGRRDAHGAAVAETVVGFRGVDQQPGLEHAAVAPSGVVAAEGAHLHGQRVFDDIVVRAVGVHQRSGDGDRHDGVVREDRLVGEQREIGRLDIVLIEFVRRTDDISNDRTQHSLCLRGF